MTGTLLLIAAWLTRSERTGRWLARGHAWRLPLLVVPLIALTAFDLAWYGVSQHSSADPYRLFHPSSKLMRALGQQVVRDGVDGNLVYPPTRLSAFLARDRDIYRVSGLHLTSMTPNTFSVFGAQDIRGWASLFTGRYLHFLRRWQGLPTDYPGLTVGALDDPERARGLFDLMGVRYLIFTPREELPPRFGDLDLVYRDDEGAVYHNRSALPRAFLVHQIEQYPNEDQLMQRLTAPGFPLGAVALMYEPPPRVASAVAGTYEQVRITRYTALEVDIQVTAASAGLLVSSDITYPGWETLLAGQPVHLYTVDGVLRGVAVPPGTHAITFRYRPRSFIVGAAISLISLGCLMVIISFVIARRVRSPHSTILLVIQSFHD